MRRGTRAQVVHDAGGDAVVPGLTKRHEPPPQPGRQEPHGQSEGDHHPPSAHDAHELLGRKLGLAAHYVHEGNEHERGSKE